MSIFPLNQPLFCLTWPLLYILRFKFRMDKPYFQVFPLLCYLGWFGLTWWRVSEAIRTQPLSWQLHRRPLFECCAVPGAVELRCAAETPYSRRTGGEDFWWPTCSWPGESHRKLLLRTCSLYAGVSGGSSAVLKTDYCLPTLHFKCFQHLDLSGKWSKRCFLEEVKKSASRGYRRASISRGNEKVGSKNIPKWIKLCAKSHSLSTHISTTECI